MDLRRTVIVEPSTLGSLSTLLSQNADDLTTYVRSGGNLVFLGVTENLQWLPWSFTYNSTPSASSVIFLEPTHPLISTPNTLPSDLPFQGSFSDMWPNYTVLAESATGDPVFIASTVGSGKIALTTISPLAAQRDVIVENIVSWSVQPSISLRAATLNEVIIWAGDFVLVTLTLDDGRGHPITGATIRAMFNDTDVTPLIDEAEPGVYTITLSPDWTNQYIGIFCLRLYAAKNGYDTLTAVLPQFIFIRPSYWPAIGVTGAIFVAIIGVYVYRKRSRGEPIFTVPKLSRRKSRPIIRPTAKTPLSKEEELRRQKEREKKEREKDLKDFFGV